MSTALTRPMPLAIRSLICGVACATLTFVTGCVPTVSLHSTRDVAVTLTDGRSGSPIRDTNFHIVYTYTPADSPFVYHVELRTPDEVRARTDADGKAVVRLADYAWDMYMYVDDGQTDKVFFSLNKDLIRNGGLLATQRRVHFFYDYPLMNLELQPVRK